MEFTQFRKEFQRSSVHHHQNEVSSKVLVSILVQTFNHEKYIKQCLDSILTQNTDFEFEILIGEDDSSDKTRDICIEYANRFPEKIRLFLHSSDNKIAVLNSPTGNFNAFYNLLSATGEYIAFCEGDDLWTDPMKLQKQVDYLAHHKEYSLIYHYFRTVNENSLPAISDEEINQPTFDINSYDLKTCKYHPLLLTICFRNVFQQIPKEMINIINVDTFLISVLGNYGEAKYLDTIEASIYRKHIGGIWSHRNKEKKYLSKIVTYQKLMDYYNRIDEGFTAEFYRSKLRSTYKSLILLELKNVKPINAIKYLSRLKNL